MRLRAATIAFASTLLFSAAAFAESPTDTTAPTAAPAATPAAPAAAADPAAAAAPSADDTVTCRYEKSTGSLFSKRICHTQREWKQMTTDSRDLMDRLDDHNRMSNGLGSGG